MAFPAPPAPSVLKVDGLVVDITRFRVTLDGVEIKLSRIPFEFLAKLTSDPERVWRHDELLRDIWGFETPVETARIRVWASAVHRALDRRFVFGVHGVGYRLRG